MEARRMNSSHQAEKRVTGHGLAVGAPRFRCRWRYANKSTAPLARLRLRLAGQRRTARKDGHPANMSAYQMASPARNARFSIQRSFIWCSVRFRVLAQLARAHGRPANGGKSGCSGMTARKGGQGWRRNGSGRVKVHRSVDMRARFPATPQRVVTWYARQASGFDSRRLQLAGLHLVAKGA